MSDSRDQPPTEPRDAAGPRASQPLSPEDWRRLEPLIDAVLDAPPASRDALIAVLCRGDATRQSELEAIVAECERGLPLLDATATERFGAVLEHDPLPMPETVAGQYRVVREVGRGGMAVVYLARDLKHDRDVALKVVRPELAAAMARVRFLQEIRIAAGLRHPHIVPLYDSGEVPADVDEASASVLYYVMPYEPGRSLRERLQHDGPLAVDHVVRILRDVTGALAHAHLRGIVHRDIKPDNVLLSGPHALVTDFGVARAVTEAATGVAAGPGSTALGTPTYMAPEQAASGGRVDHRADLYAVGVLGFELLAGRPPSLASGSSPAGPHSVAAMVADLKRLRPDVPAALADTLTKCLAPRPEERWQSADELLARLSFTPLASASAGSRTSSRASWIATGAAVLVLAVLAGLALAEWNERSERVPLRIGRGAQLTADRGLEVQPSISPDGRDVAYAVGNSMQMRIAVRGAAGGSPRLLTTDTGANEWFPRWSADGSRILFLSRGGVFSATAEGGPAREEIAGHAGALVRSATWSIDGRAIAYVRGDSLLVRNLRSRLIRLVTTGTDLHSCRWSPDSAWLACVSGNSFYVTVGASAGVGPMFGNLAPSRIVLVPAAGGRLITVTDSVSLNQSPVWSPDGRWLYYVSNRDGPRDVYALEIRPPGPASGDPVRITTGMNAQSLDFSADGAKLVYAVYSSTANAWALPIPLDHDTVPLAASAGSARPVTSGNQTVEGVRVSPDRRWLVYDSDLSGNSDIYRVPLAGGDAERLTRDSSDEFRGNLAPGGRELAYHSFATGSRRIFLLALADGSIRQLPGATGQLAMANWSPQGNAISYFNMATGEVMVIRRDRRGRWETPRVLGHGWRPEWSPDGLTIAFILPAEGGIALVPADQGTPRRLYLPGQGDPLAELAMFSEDGRELYFKSHDPNGRASFWSIPVAGGRPRLLVRFDDPAWSSNRFDFASDGRRFYFTVEDRQSDVWLAAVEH